MQSLGEEQPSKELVISEAKPVVGKVFYKLYGFTPLEGRPLIEETDNKYIDSQRGESLNFLRDSDGPFAVYTRYDSGVAAPIVLFATMPVTEELYEISEKDSQKASRMVFDRAMGEGGGPEDVGIIFRKFPLAGGELRTASEDVGKQLAQLKRTLDLVEQITSDKAKVFRKDNASEFLKQS